jgi:hypothetical protein
MEEKYFNSITKKVDDYHQTYVITDESKKTKLNKRDSELSRS